jgi:hypothetical protein
VFDNRGSCREAASTTLPSGIHIKGFPFQLERTPQVISCDAPRFGADSKEVLERVAGYTPEESSHPLFYRRR